MTAGLARTFEGESPTISVIIPTWCEAARIGLAIQQAAAFAEEVIVADAGSPDGTAERARDGGAIVVHAPKGRGPQLHAGARAARGDVLLFLHADAELGAGARAAIAKALRDPAVLGGNFHLRFDAETLAARTFTWVNHLRRRWLAIYYGDSAVFVRREAYESLGGFRPLPLLEDYDFVRRLERAGPTAYLRDVSVQVSARRFEGRPWRTLALWVIIQSLYSLGVTPERLARLYRDHR